MSLKHNPFDNSFKGTMVPRKKVFANPTLPPTTPVEAVPTIEPVQEIQTKQNITEQDKTELNSTKQNTAPNTTEQAVEQNQTRVAVDTKQNETELNTTQNKRPNKELNTTKQNKTEQVLASSEVEQKLFGLTGNRKKVAFAVYDLALENGEDEIELSYDLWSELAHIKKESIKTTVRQLKLDGYFEIVAPRGGRGAIIRVEVQKHFLLTYSKLNNKLNKKLNNTLNKSPALSSSDLEIKNNTQQEEPIWLNIPESLKGQIPINQLRNLVKAGTIDQEILEDSLWGFAHDLEKNLIKSKTGNVMGLFFGSVRNGGYVSQQYLAQKQAELREIQKAREELHRLKSEIDANKLAEEFEKFRQEHPEKAEAFKPASAYLKNFDQGSMGYKMWVEEFRKSQETDQTL